MPRLRSLVDPGVAALRLTLAEPSLRRLLLAWLSNHAGRGALLVTGLVLAYDLGGAVGVSLLGIARYLPPTLIAPLAGLPTVRWRPEQVLRALTVVRTLAAIAILAVVVLQLPAEALYLAIAVEAAAGAFNRPLHLGLMPAASRTPEQLVAANVASSAVEGLGTFLGPALASALLLLSGPTAALLATVAISAVGVIALAVLHVPRVGRTDGTVRDALGQLGAGLATLRESAGPRWLFVGFGMQTLVRGLLTVLIVIVAIEVQGMGDPGVGTLNAALGLGALVGAAAALAVTSRVRMVPTFIVSLVLWGAPIALLAIQDAPIIAILALGFVGIANALLDVAGLTLLQRLTPNRRRIPVMGLIDTMANGFVAVGGALAPVLVDALGIGTALAISAALLPITAIPVWLRLRRLDETGGIDAERTALLRGDPLFAPLSLATIEHLSGSLTPIAATDGEALLREGEAGTSYLLLSRGQLRVSQGGRPIRTLEPGAGVGEIALLEDVPRTATVTAVGPVEAFRLECTDFLDAVVGHDASLSAARSRASETRRADRERAALH